MEVDRAKQGEFGLQVLDSHHPGLDARNLLDGPFHFLGWQSPERIRDVGYHEVFVCLVELHGLRIISNMVC
jgi:hypothetical protein